MDSLSGMAVFVQAAQMGSFVGAGKHLGISASAVSKSIARLEEKLEVRLFHRSTRSLTLTAEGTRFLQRCRRIIQELEAAGEELRQTASSPQGPLRVSLPMIGKPFLPVFAEFQLLYPDIQLDLEFSDRLVDIIAEGFDAVIRSGVPKDSGLSARCLGRYRMLAVGSPDYFARHGKPARPRDLAEHRCIHFRFPDTGKLQRWMIQEDAQTERELPCTLICNSVEGRVCFALKGLGITYAADFMVREYLASGELRSVLEAYSEENGTFNLLWPSGRQVPLKLRALIDFLSDRIGFLS
ncbi:LysR family transcriptional regulator [Pseudomonas fluorescens]|uniref:LysR family transcriptional regulator n=1 Tax=Pseudomonas fluorescens TaxID=294 RepID=A0A1T2Y2C8_PSEFL|nr:LysR family transcriptional regulator [Pseudomonas fluorescens]OPA86277.1 LysR family transcriptional regulator [Pseudomonas fluorescens]